MGTRSLTVVFEPPAEGKNRPEQEIAVLYRQYDGYVDGHGHELASFLDGKEIVNGLSGSRPVFNGMDCMMASIVAHFKTEPGGFYLHSAGSRDMGEEYVYEVRQDENGETEITVIAYDSEIFRGSPAALLAFNEDQQ